MSRPLGILLGVVLLFAAGDAAGATSTSARIDALLAAYHGLGQLNGAALVAKDGVVLLRKGYGQADFEWGVPATPDTRFRIGSITKQFTAALVLQFVEEGKLSLDTKVSEVLPDYRRDTGSRITVRHLLRHTSGLPNYSEEPGCVAATRDSAFGVEEFVSRFCAGDLEFEPGTKFRYSNTGYYLLGAVIEKVTGKPFDAVLRECILEPCGMLASGLDTLAALVPKRAAGYLRTPAGLANAPAYDVPLFYAAGGMHATAEDLFRWDQALLGDQVLEAASKDTMFAAGLGGYGCGWFVKQAPIGPGRVPRTSLSHGGGLPGFNALIRRIPEDHIVVILLNNTGGTRLEAISNGILDILYGRPPAAPRAPLVSLLSKTLEEQGIPAAQALYRDLKARDYDSFDFEEARLNELGYRLLAAGRAEQAAAILALNVETFPESWRAHDSLGEAQVAAGLKTEALASYRRSLALNPKNLGAARQIEKLTGTK